METVQVTPLRRTLARVFSLIRMH